jgi:type IV pilus assembly protein PilP
MRRAALLLGLTFATAACEEEIVIGTGPPGPAPGAASAAASAALAASAVPKMDIPEAEFTESERTRDPFRSYADTFAEETKGKAKSQREVVLSQYAIDELKLIGIVTRVNPAKAMLVDPQGKGFVVHRGQFVGRADVVQAARGGASYEINWRVDRIRDGDIVLVREDPANPDVPTATRVIPLRPEGSIVVAQ